MRVWAFSGTPSDRVVPLNRLRPTYGARHVRTLWVKQAVNPVLLASAALVAREAHFGRSLTERVGTVGHRHTNYPCATPARSDRSPVGIDSNSAKRGTPSLRSLVPRTRTASSLLSRCGVGGAEDGDQGECEPAKHVPGAGPGKRVTGAGRHTTSRKAEEGAKKVQQLVKIGSIGPESATVLVGEIFYRDQGISKRPAPLYWSWADSGSAQ
jgi:hypothetical protein